MKKAIRYLLYFSIAMTLFGWWLDVVPGRLANFLFLPLAFSILVVISGGFLIAFCGIPLGIVACVRHRHAIRAWFLREIREPDWRIRVEAPVLAQFLAIPVVAVIFVLVVRAEIPVKVGFRLSHRAFEANAGQYERSANSVEGDSWNVVDSGARFGLYKVDKVGIDGRGGIYYRVNKGMDGIGPDQMSFGFAKSPNATGSPFGRSRYAVRRLAGEWFLFQASDDIY